MQSLEHCDGVGSARVFLSNNQDGFSGTLLHGQTMSSMTLPLSAFRTRATSLFRDYAELTKLRVTSLIVMTAWCGYFFRRAPSWSLLD